MTVASVIDDALFLLGEDPAFCLPEDGGEGRDFWVSGFFRCMICVKKSKCLILWYENEIRQKH